MREWLPVVNILDSRFLALVLKNSSCSEKEVGISCVSSVSGDITDSNETEEKLFSLSDEECEFIVSALQFMKHLLKHSWNKRYFSVFDVSFYFSLEFFKMNFFLSHQN